MSDIKEKDEITSDLLSYTKVVASKKIPQTTAKQKITVKVINFCLHDLANKVGNIIPYEERINWLHFHMLTSDICVIMECTPQEIHEMEESLKDSYVLAFHPQSGLRLSMYSNNTKTGMTTCIIVKHNLPLIPEQVLTYVDISPGSYTHRRQVMVVFDKFVIVGCHFPAPSHGEETRIIAAHNARLHVDKYFGKKEIIIAGDFNTVQDKDGAQAIDILKKDMIHYPAKFFGYKNDPYKRDMEKKQDMPLLSIFTTIKWLAIEKISPGKTRETLITDHEGLKMSFYLQ